MEHLCTQTRQPCRCRRIWHQSQHKTPWITFRGHSRSHILGHWKADEGLHITV